MNQSVIEKARELAQVIAQSPEYISMRAAEDAAAQDDALADAVGRYNDLHNQVERLSMQKEPDFEQIGAVTRELETVQEEIQSLPLAQAMQNARKAFSQMMQDVNATLSETLNPNSGSSCSGNCAGCAGCH